MQKKLLIIGAGEAGKMVLNEIRNHPEIQLSPAGFIDDSPRLGNKNISGLKVLGKTADIPAVCRKKNITDIIIASPSAPGSRIRKILNYCSSTNCRLKIVPGIFEIIKGDVNIQQLRDITYEDLLGRQEVEICGEEVKKFYKNKTVYITGAAGSIGSGLARHIAALNPKGLILSDINESDLYFLYRELQPSVKNLKIYYADIKDKIKTDKIMSENKIDILFHAAALKHVPIAEMFPSEAVKTNTAGTLILKEAAVKHGVKKFVLISTDKAVNPVSVMGATKRLCEMALFYGNKGKINFSAVRFGNVLGSRGSVIPLFLEQIKKGGPVTLTDKRIIRYFMTLREASELVLKAGVITDKDNLFVLDMGEPVKIYDLAKTLIKLCGKFSEGVRIKTIGIRKGEKLYEETLTAAEGIKATKFEKINYVPFDFNYPKNFQAKLSEITSAALKNEENNVLRLLKEIIKEYD